MRTDRLQGIVAVKRALRPSKVVVFEEVEALNKRVFTEHVYNLSKRLKRADEVSRSERVLQAIRRHKR